MQKDSKAFIDALKGESMHAVCIRRYLIFPAAMSTAQGRLAETIDVFYGAAADRNSEGTVAANAYKRAVDEVETTISKEFVSRVYELMNR